MTGRRTTLVVNPAAGGGRASRVWERLRSTVPELADAGTIQAASAEACRAELAEHLAAGADRILAVGGDGTAHLVVNVLLAAGRGETAAFGLVPVGTGSDLARSLGLPSRPAAALRRVLAAEPRKVDALSIETESGERRFAANIVSAGLSGVVAPAVNANPGRGPLTYLTATLQAVRSYRSVPCRVEADGEPFYDGDFFLLAMANGRYFGKAMKVAPDARLDDGLIDVVLVPPVPLWHLPFRLPQFLTGRHVKLPIVKTCKAKQVRLEPAEGFPPYEVDGECLPAGPAEIRVLPGALRVLA